MLLCPSLSRPGLFDVLQSHLGFTWIYEETKPDVDQSGQITFEIVPPPPDKLDSLLASATIGDIRAILQMVMELEEDERYKPFATKLGQLTKTFQLTKIQEMLEAYQQ